MLHFSQNHRRSHAQCFLQSKEETAAPVEVCFPTAQSIFPPVDAYIPPIKFVRYKYVTRRFVFKVCGAPDQICQLTGCDGAGLEMHDEHVQTNQRVSKGVHAEPLRGPMEEDCPATAGKLDREHGGDDLSGGDDDGERDKTTMLGLQTEKSEKGIP
ncbi:hypothetical protein ACOSQ2_019724 [Xanthoceras sorbifolium]